MLIAGGVCSGAGVTADGGRCGEKPRPNRERRWLVVMIFDYVYVSKVVTYLLLVEICTRNYASAGDTYATYCVKVGYFFCGGSLTAKSLV